MNNHDHEQPQVVLRAESFLEAAQLLREENSYFPIVHGRLLQRRVKLIVTSWHDDDVHEDDEDDYDNARERINDDDEEDEDNDDDEEEEENERVTARRTSFIEFVRELDRFHGHLVVLQLELINWSGLLQSDLELLFGRVLPNHPTLWNIQFNSLSSSDAAWVPSRWIQLFASSVCKDEEEGNNNTSTTVSSPLSELEISGGRISTDAARAIAGMIRRNPPCLKQLFLTPSRDGDEKGLDRNCLKIIGDALPHNSHLRFMSIKATEVFGDSLDGMLGPDSPLKLLFLESSQQYTREGVAGLAECLKRNTMLEGLYLIHETTTTTTAAAAAAAAREEEAVAGRCTTTQAGGEVAVKELFRPLLDAVDACNFTLRFFPMQVDASRLRVEALPHLYARNTRMMHAFDELVVPMLVPVTMTAQQIRRLPRQYCVEPAGMWPLVLEAASDVPAPLYRLLRRGALEDVVACLQAKPLRRSSKKRCRRPPSTLRRSCRLRLKGLSS